MPKISLPKLVKKKQMVATAARNFASESTSYFRMSPAFVNPVFG